MTLKIFNILHEIIAILVFERMSNGSYSWKWNAKDLTGGIYICRLQVDNYVETGKMVLTLMTNGHFY